MDSRRICWRFLNKASGGRILGVHYDIYWSLKNKDTWCNVLRDTDYFPDPEYNTALLSIQRAVVQVVRYTIIWAVNANWNSDNREWNVNANSVENPNRWNAGNQVLSHDKPWLAKLLLLISAFLFETLHFHLHPHKVSISTLASGIDFLGWVHFPHHRVLRTSTRRRMFKQLTLSQSNNATVQSYLGLLCHGNTQRLVQQVNALGGKN